MKMTTKIEPRNETWAWKWSYKAKMEAASWRRRYGVLGFKGILKIWG